ncbi:MAG: phosphoribosylformylglycinamidine synthase subunit PurS, partial [Planctomycetota bacterium]
MSTSAPPAAQTSNATADRRVYRIDVTPRGERDPVGRRVSEEASSLGLAVGDVAASRIYLIETSAGEDAVHVATLSLFADGVADTAGTADASSGAVVEVHLKAGVMDPVAATAEAALHRRGLTDAQVRTGRSFHFAADVDRDRLEQIARRILTTGVIEDVYFDRHVPAAFEHGEPSVFHRRTADLLDLDDDGLKNLSRTGHLFLSLDEMKAVQNYFKEQGREPTDIELETLAQTWSEHCVHKTLKSAVSVQDKQGNEVRSYQTLIGDTIFASTMQLTDQGRDKSFCLSVFADNAGVIAFDEIDGVCIKVETHNRPSAIEPYGGAATGIGGVIRDILGTGLGARPVANT